METRSLKSMPYAQAKVIKLDDGTKILRSYKTDVLELDADGWLTCHGTYSRTTIKHISSFMRDEVPAPCNSYYTAKEAFLGHYKLNVNTGEIIDL